MGGLFKAIHDGYTTMFYTWGDPRSQNLPLVGSPIPGLILLFLYLRFVNKWGPEFMKDRKPFNLDRLIIWYNAFNVVVSAWMFYEAYTLAWGNDYSYACQPVDFSHNPVAMRILRCTYVYYLMKIIELLDTVFFILRKKLNQASYLHIYHHTGMVMLSYGAVKWLPGGHGTFIGFLNTFVHVIMYSYYLVTAMFPQYKNNIWWKKHITQMQMVQFAAIIIHQTQLLFRECDYPTWTVPITVSQNCYMLFLFADFYRRTYLSSKKQVENTTQNGHSDSKKSVTNGELKQS